MLATEMCFEVNIKEEAQKNIIGLMLKYKKNNEKVVESFFTKKEYLEIYKAMHFLFKNEHSFDQESVYLVLYNRYKNKNWKEKLSIIVNSIKDTEFETIESYIQIIQEEEIKEKAIEISDNLKKNIIKGEIFYIKEAAQELSNIKTFEKKNDIILNKSLETAFFKLEEQRDSDADFNGVPTGITLLDQNTGGLKPTDLIILAARPGQGKTATAINFLYNALSFESGFISSEMPHDQLSLRLLALDSEVNAQKLRMPKKLLSHEWAALRNSMEKLRNHKVYINDKPTISIQEVEEQAKIWKEEKDIKILFIDYLQRLTYNGKGADKMPRSERVGLIAQHSKEIARKLEIPVVQLAQINRDVDKHGGDGRPKLSDLKDSGMIEQEADLVIGLYKNINGMIDINAECDLELLLLKNRHGPLGTVLTTWSPSIMKVLNKENIELPY